MASNPTKTILLILGSIVFLTIADSLARETFTYDVPYRNMQDLKKPAQETFSQERDYFLKEADELLGSSATNTFSAEEKQLAIAAGLIALDQSESQTRGVPTVRDRIINLEAARTGFKKAVMKIAESKGYGLAEENVLGVTRGVQFANPRPGIELKTYLRDLLPATA